MHPHRIPYTSQTIFTLHHHHNIYRTLSPRNAAPMPQPSQTRNTPASRLPAPTLFVGPPSHNASNISLALKHTHTASSTQHHPPSPTKLRHERTASTSPSPSPGTSPGAPARNQVGKPPFSNANAKSNADADSAAGVGGGEKRGVGVSAGEREKAGRPRRPTAAQIDAQWAELQSTLRDIEASASSGVHVFGPAHAGALDELRRAQVELARAWGPVDFRGKGDADSNGETSGDEGGEGQGQGQGQQKEEGEQNGNGNGNTSTGAAAGAGTAPRSSTDKPPDTTSTRPKPPQPQQQPSIGLSPSDPLSASTAADLSAAAARRRANEEYFARVKGGVQEVVSRLEEVSAAMKKVEEQSREIWGEGESLASVNSGGTRGSG